MTKQEVVLAGIPVIVHTVNTMVVGSGAGAFRAATELHRLGQTDVALMTEGIGMGTSRNTGSDKQTYYKLTLAGEVPDSVEDMARDLFRGGSCHGDLALVQAALSVRGFMHLVDIGVPFPHNRFGEYAGYRTDHDAHLRATSAGPLTSRYMTEQLESEVRQQAIPILDRHLVIGLLTTQKDEEKHVIGLMALNLDHLDSPGNGLTLVNCTNMVYATGGPAGIYLDSVYPESQTGATGIALEAGAAAANLTESQFGLGSVKFRWNLSGTYQQVLPRYLSTDETGGDAREFLGSGFQDAGEMLDAVFLKGYQWPFDPGKTGPKGSSRIDLLVGLEKASGRRVFMDFTRNPGDPHMTIGHGDGDAAELNFSILGKESRAYLEKSGALSGRPIDRLRHMNPAAVALYRDNGIDLEKEWLEVAVCAQHSNGGLIGDMWWEGNLRHFFPVGEVNGCFGIHRPGGAALNATQVGAIRAAERIVSRYDKAPLSVEQFLLQAGQEIAQRMNLVKVLVEPTRKFDEKEWKTQTVDALRREAGRAMSRAGGVYRDRETLSRAVMEAKEWLAAFPGNVRLKKPSELPDAFRLRDILLCRYAVLSAMEAYVREGGGSRGSYLVTAGDESAPDVERLSLPGGLQALAENQDLRAFVLETRLCLKTDGKARVSIPFCETTWVPVRAVPERDNWFENVWRDCREGFPDV